MSEERRLLHLAAAASAAVRGLDPVGVAEVYDAERGHVAVQVVDSADRTWLVEEAVSAADAAAEDLTLPLLDRLDARLPYAVPRPAGSVVVKGLGRISVVPWLEDRRISFDDLPAGPGLAVEIGRALAAVHNLDPALYDDAGVPTYDAEAYRRRRLSELDRAAATGHVPTGLLTRWEEALERVSLWRFGATPVHGSFDGDALRVRFSDDDVATGRITAVTTWQAAKVADPADDFAALYEAAHPDTFDTVLEAYANARTERPDRGLETRARLAAELDAVSALMRAHAAGDRAVVDELAGYLRVLDAETADHPLVQPQPTPTAPMPARPDGAAVQADGAAARVDGAGEPGARTPATPARSGPVNPTNPAPPVVEARDEVPAGTTRVVLGGTQDVPSAPHDTSSTQRSAEHGTATPEPGPDPDDEPELLLPPTEHTPEAGTVDAHDVLPDGAGADAAAEPAHDGDTAHDTDDTDDTDGGRPLDTRPARPAGSRPAARSFDRPVTGETVEIPRDLG